MFKKQSILWLVLVLGLCDFSQLFAAENESDIEVVSPLLDNETSKPHATLSSIVIKPSAHLYPVRILTINNFAIKHLLHGFDYRLAPGSYEVELVPDFSLVPDPKPFMNNYFEPRIVKVNLPARSSYLIGVRINPEATESWQVQLLEVKDAVPTDN